MEKEPTLSYDHTPQDGQTMTPAEKEKLDATYRPLTNVKLPREKEYDTNMGIDSLAIGELPVFLHDTIKDAWQYGHLPRTLSHYIGTLGGLGVIDPSSLAALRGLRRQLVGNKKADEKVLPQIIEIIDGLKPAKR